jgi:hypothetical protein|tara:strand:+ start:128 stop:613 length:486 start_codon:yes stop_codon:yes gene_type:complete
MKTVEVIRIADIPAQVIWDEMKHFDRVLRWVPGGNESTISVKGHGVGAIRDIELVTQGYVQHELVAYSEKDYSFSYKLTDGKPVGMQDYIVVAKITPINKQKTEIKWSGKVTSDKRLSENDVAEALSTALNNMITGLIALIKKEEPVFVNQPLENWQKINK